MSLSVDALDWCVTVINGRQSNIHYLLVSTSNELKKSEKRTNVPRVNEVRGKNCQLSCCGQVKKSFGC